MAIFGALTHRDIGFGDDFELPLHNGYRWVAIDDTEAASVYAPGSGSSLFDHVVELQEDGDWLTVGLDPRFNSSQSHTAPTCDRFVLYNTRTHEMNNVSNLKTLASFTSQHGFALHLETSPQFYAHRRYRWYDTLASLVFFTPGLLALVWLYKKARHSLQVSAAVPGSLEQSRS